MGHDSDTIISYDVAWYVSVPPPFCFVAAYFNGVSSQTVPQVLSQLELNHIADHFAQLPRAQRARTNHFYSLRGGKSTLFIKYGDKDIIAEADTQSFFYALSKEDPTAPGIPPALNAFRAKGYYFLVTEKINNPTLEECSLIPEEDAVRQIPSNGFSSSCLRFLLPFMVGFRPRRAVSGTRFSRGTELRSPSSTLTRSTRTSIRYEFIPWQLQRH